MKRLLALAALLLAVLVAAPAAAQENWTGDWSGTLATPAGSLRLVVTINRGADGALAGELESPDQAPGRKIPIAELSIADGRMRFAVPMIAGTYDGTWQAEERRFSGIFSQGGARLPLDLAHGGAAARAAVDGLDGIWRGSVTRNGVALRLVLRVRTGPLGTAALLDSPDMMAYGIPVQELTREGSSIGFAVPASGARYRGTLAGDGGRIGGIWSLPGQPDAEVVFVRGEEGSARRARPQTPRPPFSYRSEEVRFENPAAPGVTLAGTLTFPAGAGPFPAAILISGSGPQDRDETLLGHKPFAVLADHLSRNGIAVLRYDDRGFAESTGTWSGATSADFATDANAAFAFLSGRPEIDRGAIGFVGHSEGGLIGPLAAADNAGVAYVVLLAGPGTTTAALIESQRRALGQSVGMTEADLDRTAPMQQRLFEIAASDRDRAAAEAAMRAALADTAPSGAGMPASARDTMIQRALDPWYRWFARYDPAPVLRRLRVPILALNGSLDRQVLAAENLAGIRAALAGNPDATVTELPGLNHLFQHGRTGGLGEYADIEETFAPTALETISAWISARFARPRANSRGSTRSPSGH